VWDAPWECEDIPAIETQKSHVDVGEDENEHVARHAASRKRTPKQKRQQTPKRPTKHEINPSSSASSSTPASPGQYDDQDSFINDTESERGERAGGSSHDDDDDDMSTQSPPVVAEKSIFLSQQSIDYDAADKDFPDLASIITTAKSTTSKSTKAGAVNGSRPGRRRRVLDSDDDDD